MLEKFIEWCVKNKFFVILLTLVIVGWGLWALLTTPIDAIPDLSDVQVIIYTEWMGQSPNEVEDQVTYPLSKAMLAVPRVKAVRGYSFFSVSFVYMIFEDGTNLYWARSRVLEYLNTLQGKLPAGVTPVLGPDATGVGWVYQYTVEGKGYNLAELRAIQDWYIRYQLQSVPGVAEVASVGGFKKQYQVALDPNKLIAYNIPINTVMMAIKSSNRQIGASMLEMSETEFMVRGLGYFKNIEDIKNVVVSASPSGTPIQVRDIAYVYEAPEMRRGIAEKDGQGEVVGATVVMRHGKNALEVIKNVKKKIKEIEPGLPKGVKIVPVYDRTKLIYRAIDTLKQTLIEEIIVVSLVCVVFLWHLRSAFVSIITLPLGILISLIIMRYQGLNANIMSLGGIAIAIGAMVDASIVMVENVHKKIEHEGERRRDLWEIIIESSKEVGPSLFFSLMIIAVSFMPVFTLQAQEGRLFRPLAFTKGYAMAGGAILAITLVPVLMGYLIRGKLKPEEKNPVNRFLIWLYRPIMYKVLKIRWAVVLVAIAALIATIYPLKRLGSEFMPPLNEGDILYMPNTAPGVSVTQARQVLQLQDQILRQFPMVETVFGKMGRMETSTDPAPLDMVETVVTLKPVEEWPKKKGRFFSRPMTIEEIMNEMDAKLKMPGVGNIWIMPIKTRIDMLATGIKTPVGVKVYGSDMKQIIDLAVKIEDVLRKVPGTRNVFAERLMSGNYVDFEINREAAARYGLTVGDVQDVIESAIGGMPITNTVEGRARFPVSIRYARELRDDIEKLKRVLVPIAPGMGAMEARAGASPAPTMSPTPMSMGSSRSMGEMQRGGMEGAMSPSMEMGSMKSMNPMPMLPMSTQLSMGGSMGMGMSAPMSGSMGMSSSMPSSGSSAGNMGGSMGMMGGGMSMGGGISSMSTPMGSPLPPTSISPTSQVIQVPLAQLADIKVKKGPMAINSEGGLLRAIVFVDVATQDIGGYVDQAKKAVATSIKFPPGYYIGWSGQFEYMQRAAARLKLIVPITFALIFILLYLNFRNMSETMIVMLTLPFGVIGGIWLMYALKFNMSVAVGVGFIALAGLAAETAVIMLLFLDLSYKKLKASGEPITREKLYDAVVEGAVMRVRPKMMTVMTTILGLVPIFWEQGIGSSVMRRMATPMVGGLISSLILTLIVIPAIYAIWKGREIKRLALATTAGEIPIVAPKAEGKPVKPEAEVKAESVKSEEEGEEVEIIGAAPKSRRRAIIIIALIAALALVALGVIISYKFIGGRGVQLNAPTASGELSISLSPSNLKVGENQMKVKVLDASGKSVADAHVEVIAFMPAMPSMGMPEMRSQAEGQLQGDEYVATVSTPMAGDWEITVNVSTPETTGSEKFRMTAK